MTQQSSSIAKMTASILQQDIEREKKLIESAEQRVRYLQGQLYALKLIVDSEM